MHTVQLYSVKRYGRFLSGGIILGFPLSCTDLFLYTINLPAVSCDAPPTLSYTTLELASRVLLSSKKPALKTLVSPRAPQHFSNKVIFLNVVIQIPVAQTSLCDFGIFMCF